MLIALRLAFRQACLQLVIASLPIPNRLAVSPLSIT
jgi:hypothetical protein